MQTVTRLFRGTQWIRWLFVSFAFAGAIALCERRITSGGWFHPGFVSKDIQLDRLHGVSLLDTSTEGVFEPAPGSLDSPACGTTAACEDARAIVASITSRLGEPERLVDIDRKLWSQVWAAMLQRSLASDSPRSYLGKPAVGWAVQFEREGRTHLLVHYSTFEIEDDWHREVEALYAIDPDGLRLVHNAEFRYQISGLEDTQLWHLWLFNAMILMIGFGARAACDSTRRSSRVGGMILGIALTILGGWLCIAVLWLLVRHDAWLVVFLITAALMVTAGVLAIGGRKPLR